MSTDSQGRPLSDDGQWAWSGTEWVPAGGGGTAPSSSEGSQTGEPEDVGATMIAPSPFAAGGPAAGGAPPYSGTPQPAYGTTPQPPPGGAPGYGATPAVGYGATPVAAGPGYGGVPPRQKSRTPLILAIVGGLIVIAAIVVVLILVLGKSDKKTPSGAFTCTEAGSTRTGTITFTSSSDYTLSGGGKGGTYTHKGDVLTFTSGSIDKGTAVFNHSAKTVKISSEGATLSCKQ